MSSEKEPGADNQQGRLENKVPNESERIKELFKQVRQPVQKEKDELDEEMRVRIDTVRMMTPGSTLSMDFARVITGLILQEYRVCDTLVLIDQIERGVLEIYSTTPNYQTSISNSLRDYKPGPALDSAG